MVQIPMRTEGALNQQTVLSINQRRIQQPLSANTITTVLGGQSQSAGTATGTMQRPVGGPYTTPQPTSGFPNTHDTMRQPVGNPAASAAIQQPSGNPNANVQPAFSTPTPNATAPATPVPAQTIPTLLHPVQKGQRVPLASVPVSRIKACLGWNVTNAACDVDVSAFLLNSSGKVPGDDWFVFYGQEQSPDKSTTFSVSSGTDREIITVDLAKLQPDVAKIVFVLTINEALANYLNFSMLKDAYIRILDASSDTELVSFKMYEYYSNVTSMMIGEIYRHNNAWKFNAIGNGVERDLAGLCEYYGVQVI